MTADENQFAFQDHWAVTEEDFSRMQLEPLKRKLRARKQAVAQREDEHAGVAWNTFARRQAGHIQPFDTGARSALRSHDRKGSELAEKDATSRQFGKSGDLSRPFAGGSGRDKSGPYQAMNRGERARLLRRLLVLLGWGSLFLLTLFLALTSNLFRITQVSVGGTENSSLINHVQHMGIQGQNIFLLNVANLTSRLDALPQVASSELSKEWPNHVSVQIVERPPVLLWQTKTGTYSVDAHGKVLASSDETSNAAHLPLVSDSASPSALQVGGQMDAQIIAFATTAFRQIPQAAGVSSFKLYYDDTMDTGMTNLAEGNAHRRGSYLLISSDGWKANLGGPWDLNPLAHKLIALRAILALARQSRLTINTIDLRYGLHPVLTLKS